MYFVVLLQMKTLKYSVILCEIAYSFVCYNLCTSKPFLHEENIEQTHGPRVEYVATFRFTRRSRYVCDIEGDFAGEEQELLSFSVHEC